MIRLLIGRNWKMTALRSLLVAITTWLLLTYVWQPYITRGISMSPSVKSGRLLFISPLAYRNQLLARGDIVTIRTSGRQVALLKRIVGLPGETLKIVDGKVYIDDQYLPEPYVQLTSNWNLRRQEIGRDEFFVIGDNRAMPIERHALGKVSQDRIIGKW